MLKNTETMSKISKAVPVFLAGLLAVGLAVAAPAFAEDEPAGETAAPAGTSQDTPSENTKEEIPAIRLQVSPVSNRVFLSAGQALTYTMNVDNTGSEDFDFKVYASPYSVQSGSYEIDFNTETNRTQLSRWVTFKNDAGEYVSEAQFSLKAGERKQVEYRVEVPDDVPAGGQYASIFAQYLPKNDVTSTGIRTSSRVALILYSRTDGETKESAEIQDARIQGFLVNGKINAKASVKNGGNTDFEATTKFSVSNIFGKNLWTDEERTFSVLPDTTRDIKLEWEDAPSLGFFQVTAEFTALDQSWQQTRFVAVVPIFVIILVIILLTILIAWIIISVKKRNSVKSRKDA